MNIIKQLESALGNAGRPFRYRIEVKPANAVNGDFALLNTLCKATTIPGVRVQPRNFFLKGHSIPIDGVKLYDTEWNCTFYLDGDYSTRLILEHWLGYVDGSFSGDFKNVVPKGNLMGVITDKFNSFVQQNIISPGLDILGNLGTELSKFGDQAMRAGASAVLGDVAVNNPSSGGAFSGLEDAFSKLKSLVSNISNELENDEDLENMSKHALYGTIYITPMDYSNTTPIVTYVLHNAFPTSLQAIQFDDTNLNSISEFTAGFAFSHYTIERSTTLEERLAKGLSETDIWSGVKNTINSAF